MSYDQWKLQTPTDGDGIYESQVKYLISKLKKRLEEEPKREKAINRVLNYLNGQI